MCRISSFRPAPLESVRKPVRITETRIIETCLDGTETIEKIMDHPSDRQFIHHLAALGKLEYFADFPRPFFRITRNGSFILKGVEGTCSFQVFIIRNREDAEREIESAVSTFIP